MAQTSHIAIFPSPGMCHLIPFLALAKKLVQHNHHLWITIIIPTTGPPPKAQLEILTALPKAINYVFLSPVSLEDLPKDSAIATQIYQTMSRSLPSLRDTIISLMATTSTMLVAFIVDLFSTDAIDVAVEFHVSAYLFFPGSATVLSYLIHLPKLDEMVTGEYRDLPEPLKLPGCIPVHGKDLMDPLQDRTGESYKLLLHHSKRYGLAEGVIVNSFMDLEPGPFKALQVEESIKLPIYPVGPLIQTGSSSTGPDRSECLRWLDSQPSGSVLFVSFGSGGTLSCAQITELALGLEMSGQRFIWVVRSPNDESSNAAYLSVQTQIDPSGFLPKGFLDRNKEQGLVVPSWAPQIEILSHGSTGGFLTHCGWNSTLESIVHGVPLIAWPLYAEQKMNALMLSEDLKVALRPKVDENGLVGREEIAKAVKGLMEEEEEGKKLRSRMKDLKDGLREDGSSMKSLSELANKWRT
uniref:Glycosyltransferase n=1 Tax=Davidia involucrata TaxID=16924 RepID=A0A5B7C3V9_DAVIN